jgi:hypothetical protein
MKHIDSSTYEYLVTFPVSMGDVPLMTANTEQLEPIGSANVLISTVHDGNVLSGTFRLAYEKDITVREGLLILANKTIDGKKDDWC